MKMICKKCGGEMKMGKALENTMEMGIPDFPGMTIDSRGQTISQTGPPIMIPVMKCIDCGHSTQYKPTEE